MKQWYEELFDNYALGYEQEQFTQGTRQEVDFIEKEIKHDRSLRILDVGCGTGRHSLELAKRGYAVVGVDLSNSLLTRAKEKALHAGVEVSFHQQDARALAYVGEFDVALLICEGAFPLMETDAMNFQILQGARRALRSPGKLLLTTLNALYPLAHSEEALRATNTHIVKVGDGVFDLQTFRMTSTFVVTDDDGVQKSLIGNERFYAPSEILWLLTSLGFLHVEMYGCTPGQFTKDKSLTANDFEMLVLASC